MIKSVIVATMLALPAMALAEVRVDVHVPFVNVSIGDQEKCVDYGDSWFDDEEYQGPFTTSIEYQWSLYGGEHVLRYRNIQFNLLASTWVFGPWLFRTDYCSQYCSRHHNHRFFIRHEHLGHHIVRSRHTEPGIHGYRYEYSYNRPGISRSTRVIRYNNDSRLSNNRLEKREYHAETRESTRSHDRQSSGNSHDRVTQVSGRERVR